jgi:hypothetical protein
MSTENARRILVRDPTPHLFRPLSLRSVRTPNRFMMSPMCQANTRQKMVSLAIGILLI